MMKEIGSLTLDDLFSQYGYLTLVAAKKYVLLKTFDLEELNSFAIEAMILKYGEFNTSKGVPFEPWIIQKMRWFILDKIRETYGRNLCKTIYQQIAISSSKVETICCSEFSYTKEDSLDLEILISKICDKRKQSILRMYILGYTKREMSMYFEISESRVCQIFKSLISELKSSHI